MIDPATNPERVAFRSTRGEGVFAKKRWTELAVWYLHAPGPGGKCWIAENIGKSAVPGEVDRRTALCTDSLDRALQHFDDSAPARSVADQAHVWMENAKLDQRAAATLNLSAPPFSVSVEMGAGLHYSVDIHSEGSAVLGATLTLHTTDAMGGLKLVTLAEQIMEAARG